MRVLINQITFCTCMLMCLLMSSCGQDTEKYSSYLKTEENGLSIYKNYGDIRFVVRYMPIAYQALKDKANSLDAYYGHQYFSMQLQTTNGQDLQAFLEDKYGEEHQDKWQAFLFRLQQKFSVKIGAQNLPCALYHASIAPMDKSSAQLMFVFKDEVQDRTADFTQDMSFVYKDEIWTEEQQTFTFQSQDLNAIPLPSL